MDSEDSPWGDVPSKSSSHANLPAAGEQAQASEPQQPASPAPIASAGTKTVSRAGRGVRAARTPRRVELQSTKLESADNGLGPLGPLGEAPVPAAPPEPPVKEPAMPVRGGRPSSAQQSMTSSMMDSVEFTENGHYGGPRSQVGPPPVAPRSAGPDGMRRQGQPSMSIEQAAKPSFDITVGDPHKVGDLTSSHIVYQVHTRTSSKGYKQPEFTIGRRYRDFLWLYTTLHNSNPGVVVPPPPEKQVVGRFDTNFVESRRAALERMCNKIAAHPILQHDQDLKIFLESEAFNVDVKHREHKEPGLGESKGMLATLGLGSSTASKFIEHDDWFHDRRVYLEALENQLKSLLKSIDTVVVQRKALAEAAGEFSSSLHALAMVELAPSLSGPLDGLSEIQVRIRELYERQAQQDVLTLGMTIDEYIRLIGSIKMAFMQREKIYHGWHTAEAELQKRRTTQDKIMRSGRTQQDRLNQLQADVADGERRCHQARLTFEDMGRLMRAELERFEREKVEDFKNGVETFLEGAVEAQKELIEIWETFLMHLDVEEDDQPFLKPSVMQTEPLYPSKQQQDQQPASRQSEQGMESSTSEGGETRPGGDGGMPSAAAVTATEGQK